MHEDPEDAAGTPAQEGPEDDPQSADQPPRTEGRQNAIVHEGADPGPGDTNEVGDTRVDVVQPDGEPVPEAGD